MNDLDSHIVLPDTHEYLTMHCMRITSTSQFPAYIHNGVQPSPTYASLHADRLL